MKLEPHPDPSFADLRVVEGPGQPMPPIIEPDQHLTERQIEAIRDHFRLGTPQ